MSLLTDSAARALVYAPSEALPELLASAAQLRDLHWGRAVTFSPKVFLPLTNLCRNACDYCSFRRSPGDPGEWTMHPDEVRSCLTLAQSQHCTEALFCLGDTPPGTFPALHRLLGQWGFSSIVDYLVGAGKVALEKGILPHTNAGILTGVEMLRLRSVNVSLGLMLETTSDRLCQPGMPHHKAPDKRPQRRLQMLREAGELQIPFTTGILVGIGETRLERIESLLAIRQLHRTYGHIQEVIVQNFRAGSRTNMRDAHEPLALEVAEAVAWARLILDPDISIQAPPNLNSADTALLLAAGINDLGGISPVTPDYINPGHPWPHLQALAQACAEVGFRLTPRLPIYASYLERPGFLDPGLCDIVRQTQARPFPMPLPPTALPIAPLPSSGVSYATE